jgi:hypothetical protein
MAVLLIICLPVVAITIWAVAYDRRHRKDPVTGHDPRRTAMRTRADGDARGMAPPGDGGFNTGD